MHVIWQGDHQLLGDEKSRRERELERLGLDPSNYLVEVRRQPDVDGGDRPDGPRYNLYISDVAHPEHETCRLHGGHGRDWIAQYVKIVTRYR